MRRRLAVLGLVALLGAVGPAGGQEAPAQAEATPAAEPQLVEMGTGGITGAYFPVGVALCRLVNQHRRETDLRCAARLSDGSVANLAGLRDDTLSLALVQSDVQAEALAGSGPFAAPGPFAGLAAVAALYPEPLTLVARADAGIAQVEDLAGKRVWIGPEGSGTRVIADAMIAALGWTPASFAETPAVASDLLGGALCDGQIDAFLYTVGHPALVIQEATTGCDARLVPIDGPAIDELVAATPAFVAATIPAGLYRGTPGAIATFGVEATLVTREDVPEDTVYTVVSTAFDDLDTLRALDPVLARLAPETLVGRGLTAPLHPGAARFYRERGWLQ
jgi:TRAP transporter TAXI family solute receptor